MNESGVETGRAGVVVMMCDGGEGRRGWFRAERTD